MNCIFIANIKLGHLDIIIKFNKSHEGFLLIMNFIFEINITKIIKKTIIKIILNLWI